MKKRIISFLILTVFLASFSSAIVINEFTTDPQTDRNGDNKTTGSDEWFELYNPDSNPVNLSGWTLNLTDGTNVTVHLEGIIQPNKYFTILNPTSDQKNDGQITLYNSEGVLVDSVAHGTWNDGNITDNAPDGNADSFSDECLARIPNGQDTGIDKNDFIKTECTYNAENGVTPQNQQDLNVTITGTVAFQVLPRNLEFGFVQPGSQNNPATNGPIIFNITGSTADAQVEITEVFGFPFNQGLKIDGQPATGSFWIINYTSPIQIAFPTLDIPEDAQPGHNQGIITYTVTGLPPQ